MENTMESTIWCLWVGGSLRGSESMSCIEPPASEHRDKRAMRVLEALVEGVVLGSPTSLKERERERERQKKKKREDVLPLCLRVWVRV